MDASFSPSSTVYKKGKALMHQDHKPSKTMLITWAGDTVAVIEIYSVEAIPAYEFVTPVHINTHKHFVGVTRIIQCDSLKIGVQTYGKEKNVLNKSHQKPDAHYGTTTLSTRVRISKDKTSVESTVGIISIFLLSYLSHYYYKKKCTHHFLSKTK